MFVRSAYPAPSMSRSVTLRQQLSLPRMFRHLTSATFHHSLHPQELCWRWTHRCLMRGFFLPHSRARVKPRQLIECCRFYSPQTFVRVLATCVRIPFPADVCSWEFLPLPDRAASSIRSAVGLPDLLLFPWSFRLLASVASVLDPACERMTQAGRQKLQTSPREE